MKIIHFFSLNYSTLQVHKVVIDCFVTQKDRQALTQYKMALHPQSDEYFYAENALRISVIYENFIYMFHNFTNI